VWIKIGRKKQVYCSKEVGKRKTTGDFMKMQKRKLRADLMQKKISGKEVEKNEDEAKEDKKNEDEKETEDEKENEDEKKNEDESGVPDLVFSDDEGEEMSKEKLKSRTKPAGVGDSGLKRTIGDAAQEKFRITVEHRAVVYGYFDPAVEVPVGINWRYALVVKGVHARLRNITMEGRKGNKNKNNVSWWLVVGGGGWWLWWCWLVLVMLVMLVGVCGELFVH
jgi:hypothetical protein